MMSQVGNLFQYYQKWVSEGKKTFSEHFNENQLIYHFKTKIVEQNKLVAKMWVYLIFKIHQYKKNDFHIKNLNNFYMQYWFRKDTGLSRKLVCQGNWFGRETGFLLPLLKFLSLYLWWNKLLIMQKLVTLQFCDFLRN